MISENTFKQIQAKTFTLVTQLAHKIWEHKYIAVPVAILGYGLVKNHVSLRSVLAKASPQKVEREDDNKSTERNKSLVYLEKKKYKPRMHAPSMSLHAKLSSTITFKEEALVFDDVVSPCQIGKGVRSLKTQLSDKITTDSTNSGYHSDIESAQEDMVNAQRKTSNPDDLFFTIYQKLK